MNIRELWGNTTHTHTHNDFCFLQKENEHNKYYENFTLFSFIRIIYEKYVYGTTFEVNLHTFYGYSKWYVYWNESAFLLLSQFHD